MSVTLPSGTGRGPVVSATGTWPRLAGVPNGSTGWIVKRWFGPSTKPPVPGVDPSIQVSGETSCALPAVSMICASVT